MLWTSVVTAMKFTSFVAVMNMPNVVGVVGAVFVKCHER